MPHAGGGWANRTSPTASSTISSATPNTGSARGPIDIEYLRHLGPETLPALRWLAERATEPGVADAARRTARTLSQELEEDLSDWRGWTLRRARLARANKAAVSRPFSGSDH